jgi:hypothetical protein
LWIPGDLRVAKKRQEKKCGGVEIFHVSWIGFLFDFKDYESTNQIPTCKRNFCMDQPQCFPLCHLGQDHGKMNWVVPHWFMARPKNYLFKMILCVCLVSIPSIVTK